ncbi:hypothetical protein PNEG_00309 [Pneumocystis murina B123]|uniref:tRNA wybutosine-synthesizing protein 4 n=1 Tax=Pneumocystis murina (strain B123) TaxID=1069680 RepID=M7PBP2_PNEMU|nr:hypothetical protein PNEG_00309 [Pneumocystis murina B123]EMR11280.1 hypothetical protein PNEG_00309 [Pneumocystis murina B123]
MQISNKKDKIIQGTNDTSIVSKRSAEYCGYPFSENQYLRAFVKKPQRRSPVINRGYYIRCQAIETVIQNFVSEKNNRYKIIINLGCGYDPMPFRYISKPEFNYVRFFDVDFQDLIERKALIIQKDKELKEMSQKYVLSNKNKLELQYQLIGCDIRNLDLLKTIINEKCHNIESMDVLFISEVAMVYIQTEFSDKLIEWASSFPYASFVILEQILPCSKNHPFGRTMISHFNKLKTPLYSLDQYPTLILEYKRFSDRGWNYIEAFDLWTFWNYGIDKKTRNKVNLVEDFDEWEEIILFLQHYYVLIAKNLPSKKNILLSSPPEGHQYLNSNKQPQVFNKCMSNNSNSNFLSKKFYKVKGNITFHRRFGAASLFGQNTIIYHGGISESGRDKKTFLITHKENKIPELNIKLVDSRVCHTLDYCPKEDILICIGGRESPCKLSNSGWKHSHLTQNIIKPIPDGGRYRHGMIKVTLQNETRFIIFGGNKKTSKIVDKEWVMWSDKNGWEILRINSKDKPQPRWGMCIIWLPEREEGIICGGMNEDGLIYEDIWTFKITILNKEWFLEFLPWRNISILDIQCISRLGAKAVNVIGILNGDVLIVGGVSMFHCISWNDQFILLDLENQKIIPLNVQSLENDPILIGFDIIRRNNDIFILGGGCLCFSFGICWNDDILILSESNSDEEWLISEYENTKSCVPTFINTFNNNNINMPNSVILEHTNPIIRLISSIKINSKDEWEEILEKNMPIVLKELDIGTCVEKWTPEYLISRIGSTRKVIVHNAKTNFMNFHEKNFSYETMEFEEFINSIYKDGSKLYMRSISTKNPRTKPSLLEEDFPEISDDLNIPKELSQTICPNKFSSPLRISSKNIGMWLHYDVMSNILIQIRGSKKVQLYPPSDVLHLQFLPGSSSSKIPNIFTENPENLRNTHSHQVILYPGDILYIPAFWLHAVQSLEPSISVNVFWRHLDYQYYSTLTNDVYGNKDLKAYENGRILIKKIFEGFRGLTGDERGFYLQRLAAELIEMSNI